MVKHPYCRFGVWATAGTYCGEENQLSYEESSLKTEMIGIVLRRYHDYFLPDMYKSILKGRRENHPCIWSKKKRFIYNNIWKNNNNPIWTWPILEFWGWDKMLGRAGPSCKWEEGRVWASAFPPLLFSFFSIWLMTCPSVLHVEGKYWTFTPKTWA